MTLAGQAVGALVDPDARNLLSVAPHASVAHAIDRAQEFVGAAVTIVVLSLLVLRLQGLRFAARRSQGPLLAAAVVTVLAGAVWLGAVIAADASRPRIETVARAFVVSLPLGIVAGILWSRLRRPEASELVVELQAAIARVDRGATREGAWRSNTGDRVSARRWAVRRRGGSTCRTATRRRPRRHGRHGGW